MVNAGDSSTAFPFEVRGVSRFGPGVIVDIGAVELKPLVVNSTADPGDGTCDATCTLRDALLAANANGGGVDDIGFNPSLFSSPQTILLASPLPEIVGDLTVSGPGSVLLKVQRQTGGDYRIFLAGSAARASLAGITVSNGRADYGGGVRNLGRLSLVESVVSDGNASIAGGGVSSESGSVLLLDRTSMRNNLAADGGAIYLEARGTNLTRVRLANSTIVGNGSFDYVAGISNNAYDTARSELVLLNATITSNISNPAWPGGLVSYAGDSATAISTLTNSIVANNSPPNLDAAGTAGAIVTSLGHNLTNDGGSGLLVAAGDLVNTNPGLMPLAYNGGPTFNLLPGAGSPAIDAGDTAAAPARDQRGVPRPSGAAADIGAVERYELYMDGFE